MEHCKLFYRSESFYQESCFLSFRLQPLYSKSMIHKLFVPHNPTQDFICISNLVSMCVCVCMIFHVYVFLCLWVSVFVCVSLCVFFCGHKHVYKSVIHTHTQRDTHMHAHTLFKRHTEEIKIDSNLGWCWKISSICPFIPTGMYFFISLYTCFWHL